MVKLSNKKQCEKEKMSSKTKQYESGIRSEILDRNNRTE